MRTASRRCNLSASAGTYHATYSTRAAVDNASLEDRRDDVAIGVGGMGDSTVAIGLAVLGDLPQLQALDRKALRQTNSYGELPTHRAANASILAWLATEGEVPTDQPATTAQGGSGQLPIHAYAMRGDIASLEWLDAHNDRPGLLLAPAHGSTGMQAVHFAAASRAQSVLAWLHEHGADIQARSSTGQQPVHLSALGHDIVSLRWLHKNGADLGAVRATDRATAAHFAASGASADPRAALRTMMWLERHGVDLLARTVPQRQTAFDLWPADTGTSLDDLATSDGEFNNWWMNVHRKDVNRDQASQRNAEL